MSEEMTWRPIDSAPSAQLSDDRILVVGGAYHTPQLVLPDGDWWRKRRSEGGKTFTHWMPLPLPPAEPTP